MMKTNILLCLCLCLFAACGDIDNYEEPSATLTGGVYDKSDQTALIPAQSPNGCRIRLYSTSKVSTTPVNFYCKADGTFENTKLFADKYKAVADGPFVASSIDTVQVDVPTTNVKLYAEPCLRIAASASLSGNSITVQYTVNQSSLSTGTCDTYYILYSTFERIDINNFTASQSVAVSAAPLGRQHSFTFSGVDTSGRLYARVAARTSETSYYNYSDVIQLK